MAREIITDFPREKIISMMYDANFPKHDSEAIYVGDAVYSLIRTTDIIPLVSEHQGLNLAARTLVSGGFFREYMKHLNEKHGYPKIEFYITISKPRLIERGKRDIADNMENWMDHLHELFQIKDEQKELVIRDTNSKAIYSKRYPKENTQGFLKKGYTLGEYKPPQEDLPDQIALN